MRLIDLFLTILRERGIEKIGTFRKFGDLTEIALLVANGKYSICKCGEWKYAYDLSGREVDAVDACLAKCDDAMVSREDILRRDTFPYVAVDCRFYELHSEKEKYSLELQIKQTLGVVRKYMWDDKLIVTHHDFGVGRFYPSLEGFLSEKGIERVVLLDPNAERVFSNEEARCYVIGGIVDKSYEKVGLTSKIGEALEKSGFEVEARKILLRGDIVGVPDRINHIAEILLRVVLDGEDIEKAVRSVQPPLVAKWRLRKELPGLSFRICSGGRTFRAVKKSDFDKFDWLNLERRHFYEVCSEFRFFVLSDDFASRLGRWNERRRCYELN